MSDPVFASMTILCFILGLLFMAIPLFCVSIADFVVGGMNLNGMESCGGTMMYTIVTLPSWLIVSGAVAQFAIFLAPWAVFLSNTTTLEGYGDIFKRVLFVLGAVYTVFLIIWSGIGAASLFATSCLNNEIGKTVLATLVIDWVAILFSFGYWCGVGGMF